MKITVYPKQGINTDNAGRRFFLRAFYGLAGLSDFQEIKLYYREAPALYRVRARAANKCRKHGIRGSFLRLQDAEHWG